ncbi:MAG: DNA-binding protein WhiA [Clostridia bacterium]|nr:DNA-binding protein WhiA [Clostridia bacterium]
MSFSSEVKEELSKINTFAKKELLEAELIGYLLSSNIKQEENNIEFFTENEFNIERIYKILFKLDIEYDPETKGKTYVAKIEEPKIRTVEMLEKDDEKKALVRGIFLGSGSVNNPNKKYHLEILLNNRDVAQYIQNILKEANIKTKILEKNNTIYIKEGEEISKFLAFIGAQKSVLKFEEIRVMKDLRNNVNRQVNCETANLNKTVGAAVIQIEAINFLKKMKKYEELPDSLIEIAELRIEYPEMSLKDLGKQLESPIGKSGVNHRLKKIVEIADEIKRGR